MTRFDRQTLDPRRAYLVKRYHTWPVLHQQSVGEHSIQVWRILRAIYPNAPAHLQDHALTHDIGEGATGDPPYPVKASDPKLKEIMDKLEEEAHLGLCIPWQFPPPVKSLTKFERQAFKLAEYLEMYEYGLDELALGNRNGKLIATRMHKQVVSLLLFDMEHADKSSVQNLALAYFKKRAAAYETLTGEPVPVYEERGV